MKFEKYPPSEDKEVKVTFEIIEGIKFREQVVAFQALGSLVHDRKSDSEARILPAMLGVRISSLNAFSAANDPDKKEPLPTNIELTQEELLTLHGALGHFVDDTSDAIQALLISQGPAACSARAVEADIATHMKEKLEEYLPDLSDASAATQVVGFARR